MRIPDETMCVYRETDQAEAVIRRRRWRELGRKVYGVLAMLLIVILALGLTGGIGAA